MQNEETYARLYEEGKLMLKHHQSWDEIQFNLSKIGADETTAVEIVKQLKLIYWAQKRKSGLNYIGIGASLLLVSFIYVCASFNTQTNFTYVMYGFTSAGLLLMFYGLYEMIG